MLRNPADAEEAVQQALLQGWDAIGEFRSEATLYAWLRTILFNECLTTIQRRSRVARSRLAVEKEYCCARDLDPEQPYLREELERVLHHEIRCLPRPFREVMSADLATIDEERNRTYARSALTGMNLYASKALCHRARKSLRDRMERRWTRQSD
jgi:RNA polymerase sigma factor (sigma-70 family)